jgi:hypothetical protein
MIVMMERVEVPCWIFVHENDDRLVPGENVEAVLH